MAKTFTLCLIVLITAHTSFAQKIRFNDNTNLWIVCSLDPYDQRVDKYGNSYRPSYPHHIAHDTIINGYTYYVHTRFGAIRNDSTGEKFYHLKHPDSTEKLFMDYTMNVGDTLPYFNAVLESIDSVQVNGVYHRLFDFNNAYILEGIGPSFSHSWAGEAQYYRICCFMQNGAQVSVSPAPWYYYGCELSVDEAASGDANAVIAPNPITPDSRIILPQTIARGSLCISNTLGQTVTSRTINNEVAVPLPETLLAGVYFYRVSDEVRAQNFSGRFIVE